MRRGSSVPLCFALSLSGAVFLSSSLHADGLSNYYAKLHEYFFQIEALPIKSPQGEEPGDVYVTAGGQIYLRKADCFNELRVRQNETTLPNTVEVNNSNLAGDAAIESRRIEI